MSSTFESIYEDALHHVGGLWSQVVQPFILEHPIATFFLAYFGYVAWMIVYRCYIEGHKYVAPPTPKGWDEHKREVARVREQFNHFLKSRAPGQMVSINRSRGGHNDSNRTIGADYKSKSLKVDVSRLDGVIDIDPKNMLLHIEPGLPQDELGRISLAYGFIPTLVLEFPGITAGGAVSGGGIESTSHKFGCFLDTVVAFDIITGDGTFIENVTRDGPHGDLFAAVSASYGTIGIITRLTVRLLKAPRYIHARYVHSDGAKSAMEIMRAMSQSKGVEVPDYIDGVALSPTSAMTIIGYGVDEPPAGVKHVTLRRNRSDPWFFWHLVDYARKTPTITFEAFKNAMKKKPELQGPTNQTVYGEINHAVIEEYMDTEEFLYRFDRGAFWMARHGLQFFYGNSSFNPDESKPSGPSLILRLKYAWICTTRQLYRILHGIGDNLLSRTYIVQDFVMPSAEAASELVEYTSKDPIAIWPLWLCPVKQLAPRHPKDAGFGFPVNATPDGDGLWFNVGVYGTPSADPFDPVVVNRNLEKEVTRLEGRKMLYAQSFYTTDEFWSLFNKEAYESSRAKYHSVDVFPPVDKKLLMGEKRIAESSGLKKVSLLNAWPALLTWYLSIWGELILPRFIQPCFNIHHTGLTFYTPDNTYLKQCITKKAEWGGEPISAAPATTTAAPVAEEEDVPVAPVAPARKRASSRSSRAMRKRD